MRDTAFILRRISTILAVCILTLTFLAAVTGALMAFYYEPTAGGAYESLTVLTTQVAYGWLVRRVHDLAGNLVIAAGLIQMVVMFLGSRFRRSWVTAWISGILFILVAIGLGWTAMILDWSQIGFWRLRVELGIIESIPVIGTELRNVLTGGGAITSLTIAHMYALHSYLLSFGAVGLAIAHLVALVWQEREMSSVVPRVETITQSRATDAVNQPQSLASPDSDVTATA